MMAKFVSSYGSRILRKDKKSWKVSVEVVVSCVDWKWSVSRSRRRSGAWRCEMAGGLKEDTKN